MLSIARKKISEKAIDDGQIANRFSGGFGEIVDGITDEKLAEQAHEQRLAAKSKKERQRVKKRPDVVSCRARAGTKDLLLQLARKNGGKTISDGLDVAIIKICALEGLTLKDDHEDA